ncbi:oxidoreductase, partial [Mycobacterium sp. ITM-2017-0098]
MRLFERYRQTPPSASGRLRHDPTLGLADAALAGLFAASAAVRRIRPPGGGPDTFP